MLPLYPPPAKGYIPLCRVNYTYMRNINKSIMIDYSLNVN